MVETFDIAGYCRISVDDELDRDNVSIENQKAIITDFVKTRFPGSRLTLFEDRDRSGYTFEHREGYQRMRKGLISHKYDILIVKDFSRFSRRNSRGLVELEDLRDFGARIISIGDGIDFPNDDDWLKIQFQFLINEMPVTDTSKKVRNVIKRRQADGKWICAAPYGYIINRRKEFVVVPSQAEVVRQIFDLYNSGWGYKRIANHLTDKCIPTPRMEERMRREAEGETSQRPAKTDWSIATVHGILGNDFYIGTFRQRKFARNKINGKDIRLDSDDNIVLEDHHQPIIDKHTFSITQTMREKRSHDDYRGIKKYDNVYSGFLVCGDCGSPMFSMSRSDLKPAYVCGKYHRRGRAGCTSHHVRVDLLDELMRMYIEKVYEKSESFIERLNADLAETGGTENAQEANENLSDVLDGLQTELKATKRQRVRDILKHPEQEAVLDETYDELENDLQRKIEGVKNQIAMLENRQETITNAIRAAKTAHDVFAGLIAKEKYNRADIAMIVKKIRVYEDHVEVQLQSDIDAILQEKTPESTVNFKPDTIEPRILVQSAKNHTDKVYGVNVVSEASRLLTTLTVDEKLETAFTSFVERSEDK